ncbi:hypothetical protein PGT21_032066 [Puccinia graminis f. sp. tritici]|uniref:Myb/SANT-like domain-containing protein n=1 Tax=Puccinia graminis f. sp. tritici TaxID=56615 RepID=A0A5B0NFA2_PUCGR|nr:hypothetical protein PGT21_032066 [Puccinia graminis f. sp. tritici]
MPPRPSKRPIRPPKLPSRPSSPPPYPPANSSQPPPSVFVLATHHASPLDHIPMSGLHIQSAAAQQSSLLPPISEMDWSASQSLPPIRYAPPDPSQPSLQSAYAPSWDSNPSTQPPPLPLSGNPVPSAKKSHPIADPIDTDNQPEPNRSKTLQWTPSMEKAAIQLYSDAALEGKRSDNGFKSDVHQHVVNRLNEQFPGSDFTLSKCKSKLSQSFKKEYDAFVACRNASGFGWDDIRCEVTASNKVWENFLKARRFRNQPFPEWEQLQNIFGASASGDAAKSLSQRAKEGVVRGRPDEDSSSSDAVEKQDNQPRKTHTRKRIRQTTGAAFSSAIHGLIEAFAPQASSQNSTQPSDSLRKTDREVDQQVVNEAIDLFQSTFADQLPMDDLVVGFSVLENPSKARLYLKVEERYKNQWLSYEIQKHSHYH